MATFLQGTLERWHTPAYLGDLKCPGVTVSLHNCVNKVKVCVQCNCEVKYNMNMNVHICFSAAAEEGEDGAIGAGHIPGALGVPAPSPSFSPLSRGINSFSLQKQFELCKRRTSDVLG